MKKTHLMLNPPRRPRRVPDMKGLRFGRLTVLGVAGLDSSRLYWFCICDCGAGKTLPKDSLISGATQSCGCLQKDIQRQLNTTHGMSNHRVYSVWTDMLARCYRETHPRWSYYGGRGIQVCERWLENFENFWQDMGPGYVTGLTLDRYPNNDGNYELENCRWATIKESNRNTRRNRTIDTPMGKMLLCEATEISGIKHTILSRRIVAGWPIANLFDHPEVTKSVASKWSQASVDTI